MKSSYLLLITILLLSGKVLSQSASDSTAYEENLIYAIVDTPADFPKGMKGLYKFLHREIQYPADARRNGISGKLYVQFVVTRDGSIDKENIVIIKSLYPSLDDEAIRLVKLMPNWKPALKDGKPVNSKFVLPLTFNNSRK